MSNEGYNGWTNRATWLFNLWFGDDFDDEAEALAVDSGNTLNEATNSLADTLRARWEELLEEANIPDWLSDFIDDDINFQELAESMLSEYSGLFDDDGNPLSVDDDSDDDADGMPGGL